MFLGIAFTVIAAFLAVRLMTRALPHLSEVSLSPDEQTMESGTFSRDTVRKRLIHFNQWFIRLRWVAILVALVLTYLVVQLADWLPYEVLWRLALAIGVLAFLNLGYDHAVRKGWYLEHLLLIQAYVDLLILTVMLHYSGGIENPLALLMIFHVIIAGIVLSRWHCFAVAAAASGLLALLAVAEASGLLNHYTLAVFPHAAQDGGMVHAAHQPAYVSGYVGLLATIFFLTGYFVTTLADRLRKGEQQLEQYADQAMEHRQLIEKALETTNTGLCVCNENGEPYWFNRRWRSWFDDRSLEAVAQDSGLEFGGAVCNVLKQEGGTTVNEITLPPDGPADRQRSYHITTAPIHDKQGRVMHAVSLAQDITEQKKAQQQMLRAGKLAAVGELAGHVAHEVNNPIGIISAKARLLISDHRQDMSEKVHQELEKIIDASDRVAHIAQGLLSYCRQSVATRNPIDVSDPIHAALNLIEQRAEKSGVEIENRLAGDMPFIEANADEMQQVFLNLMLNALDAMPDGGRLTISFEEPAADDHELTVHIADTGNGIPEDIQDRIFEPFYTTKQDGKGTGLGLSICAGIIQSHGGQLQVDSAPGEGTVFSITMPVIHQHAI